MSLAVHSPSPFPNRSIDHPAGLSQRIERHDEPQVGDPLHATNPDSWLLSEIDDTQQPVRDVRIGHAGYEYRCVDGWFNNRARLLYCKPAHGTPPVSFSGQDRLREICDCGNYSKVLAHVIHSPAFEGVDSR